MHKKYKKNWVSALCHKSELEFRIEKKSSFWVSMVYGQYGTSAQVKKKKKKMSLRDVVVLVKTFPLMYADCSIK